MTIPIFLDVRYNFTNSAIVPFVGLKLGYALAINTKDSYIQTNVGTSKLKETSLKGMGFYASPSAGVKFMLGRKAAINVGVAYSMQMRKYSYIAPASDGSGFLSYTKDEPLSGVTLKIGLEF
jgi:hypothetical protein